MSFRVILYLILFTVTIYSRPVYSPTPTNNAPDVTIAVSADGQTVAIARSSGGGAKRYARVELWNTGNGELQRTITGFDGPIWSDDLFESHSTELSDSTVVTLVTAFQSRLLVRVGSMLRISIYGCWNGTPKAIAFSPDGRLVAVATVNSRWPVADSDITLRELATGKEVNKLRGKNDFVLCLRFVLEGRALLIGSLQYGASVAMGTVKVWDLRENRLGKYDVREGKAVSSLVHLPDRHAVVLQAGTDVEIRDVKTWKVLHTFDPTSDDELEKTRHSRFLLSPSRADAVGFSSDGRTVSAELPGEGIRMWDRRTGGMRNRIPRPVSDEVTARSSSGDFIAEATAREVRLVNLVTGVQTVVPIQMPNRVSAIGLSRDGRSLATADDVGDIRIWDLSSGQLKKTFETGEEITALAIDPSGQLLAAARADHSIGLWNVTTGPLQVELRKHQDVVNALAFSPDGKTIASGGDDRIAILWDVARGKVKRTLKGHDLTVTSLAFSHDGQSLATATGNASVVLWNVRTGKVERILR